MGKVVGIAIHDKKGPMVVFAAAKVTFEQGVGDDYLGALRNERQVSVMTLESWEAACTELNRRLHWSTRRANILIEGVDLENSKGMLLKIGNFFLEITGELKPGNRMDEQILGLKKALSPHWRGGVSCKVLSEGIVKEGDPVVLGERTN